MKQCESQLNEISSSHLKSRLDSEVRCNAAVPFSAVTGFGVNEAVYGPARMEDIHHQHPKNHFSVRHLELRPIFGLGTARREHLNATPSSLL